MHFYLLNINLAVRKTGIESSSLLRSQLLSEQLGVHCEFITFLFRAHWQTEIQRLVQLKELLPNIPITNIFDYFQGFSQVKETKNVVHIQDGAVNRAISATHDKNYNFKDEKNRLRLYLIYNTANQRLHYVNYFHAGRRWRRDYFHESGYLSCTQLLNIKTSQVEQEIFFNAAGRVRLILRNHFNQRGRRVNYDVQILNEQGGLQRYCPTREDFFFYFLCNLFKTEHKRKYLLVEKNKQLFMPAFRYTQLARTQQKKVVLLSSLHNLHERYSKRRKKNVVNSSYKDVFEHLDEIDGLLVQTQLQKEEIQGKYKTETPIFALPHAYDVLPKKQKPEPFKINPYQVVQLARYARDKRLDLSIKAFALVVQQVPEACLYCYGAGPLKNELNALIKKLQLTKHVFLVGWTDQVGKQLEQSALSLNTSPSESYSLGIVESLAHGCPVVAFNVPYGPQALIHEGVNGFLVPFKDTQALAKRIIFILNNQALQKKLSKGAKQSASAYRLEVVAKQWESMFNDLTCR